MIPSLPDNDFDYQDSFVSDYDDDEDEDTLEETTNPDPPLSSDGPKGRALAEIRHKLEHNFFSRSDLCDKLQVFETLNDCLEENQGKWCGLMMDSRFSVPPTKFLQYVCHDYFVKFCDQ